MNPSCPYTLIAHYNELEWVSNCLIQHISRPMRNMCSVADNSQASSFGIDFDLVRVSVGLEDIPDIRSKFQQALDAVASVKKS